MKHLDLTGLQEIGRLFKSSLAGKADFVHGHTADAVVMTEADPTTVAEEIADLKNSSADAGSSLATSISNKGVSVPDGTTLAQMSGYVDQIAQLDTSDATADASDMLSGKTAYVDGNKLTGTIATQPSTTKTITRQRGTASFPAGYYQTSHIAQASFSNLVADNVRDGVSIGGILGNFKANLQSMRIKEEYQVSAGSFNVNLQAGEMLLGVFGYTHNRATVGYRFYNGLEKGVPNFWTCTALNSSAGTYTITAPGAIYCYAIVVKI